MNKMALHFLCAVWRTRKGDLILNKTTALWNESAARPAFFSEK
jgi:hypothetical protein